MSFERSFEVERGSVNTDQGTFRAVVFTDGEASDGHRLRMSGAQIPESLPLFVNHEADPRTQLGTLYRERVTPHKVIMRGHIFTGGEGAEAEIRRDLLAKMSAGHVSQMSGRWDANDSDVTLRRELKPEDPFFIDDDTASNDMRYRYGLSFERWRALEGSIVGLGADREAVVRFAHDETASEAVRGFWARALTDAHLEEEVSEAEIPQETPAAPAPPDDETILHLFRDTVAQLMERGFAFEDLEQVLEDHRPEEMADALQALRTEVTDLRELLKQALEVGTRRVDTPVGPSVGPLDAPSVVKAIIEGRRRNEQANEQLLRDYRHLCLGGVIRDPHRRAAAEAFKERVES